jgi:AcrR family transcriptional regulator
MVATPSSKRTPRRPPKTAPQKPRARGPRRTRYHHGNLREALVEATIEIIESEGLEAVSVREAAKRAGVSAGAPFRHFPSKRALLTAVAEEAHRRFRTEIEEALAEAEASGPLARMAALGTAYLRWANRNPTAFRVVSTRELIDYEGSDFLRRDNEALRATIAGLMAEAAGAGKLRSADLPHVELAARALVYGLARMAIDGHFAQWRIAGETPEESMRVVLALFMASIAAAD